MVTECYQHRVAARRSFYLTIEALNMFLSRRRRRRRADATSCLLAICPKLASSRWPSDGVEYGELSTWIQCRMRGSGFGARSIANSRGLVYGIQEGLGFPFNTHGLCIYARPCASTLRRVFFPSVSAVSRKPFAGARLRCTERA